MGSGIKARALLVASGGLGAALLVASGPACNLVVSTDGLAGPAQGDASVDAPSAGDARVPDAMAGDASDGAAAGFCGTAGPSLFCADFDSAPEPTTGWTYRDLRNGGELAVDDDHVSAPRAFRARVGATEDTEQGSARLYAELGVVPDQLRVEADAKLCVVGSGYVEWLKVELPAPSFARPPAGYENADVALGMIEDGPSVVQLEHYRENMPPFHVTLPLVGGPQAGRWFHVRLDIGLSTRNAGYVRVYLDGNPKPAFERTGIQTMSERTADVRLLVGAFSYGNDAACTNRFDNVIVRSSPPP